MKRFLSSHSPSQAAEWQPLRRTAAEEQAHARWVEQQVYLNWAGPYFKAYHFSKAGIQGQGLRAQLLDEPGRRGVVMLYDPSIGPGNFRHFFDLLRDRVLALGYNLSTSDQRTLHHEQYTETIDKHLLKPRPNDCTATGRCNQRYGNVVLDLVRVNGQPGFIRFFSNPYHDAIFTPPHSFEELLAAVLDLPPAPAHVQALIPRYAKG
ncbi:hypothetical protein [Hymenobacter psychrotolerans]|uniref:Uncharacterized protein n=1 Tax=Hymenobacter psychrotolerans DSM 18569 TaxID=1121959 RepID=A0A1M6SQK0_9BACT|nr:hypothetical protein [Hymenobacter psychrotolerans]SHK46965.1 hypothetical protein SAMN02746009_00948 [Hymenobacter psychrotolerans DSM 18569]